MAPMDSFELRKDDSRNNEDKTRPLRLEHYIYTHTHSHTYMHIYIHTHVCVTADSLILLPAVSLNIVWSARLPFQAIVGRSKINQLETGS